MTRRTLNQLLIGSPRALLSIHADTADYRNRILSKGATIRQDDLLAIDRFIQSIYVNNLRSLILECYPFAGNNLASALTKLWHNSTPDLTNNGFTDANYSSLTGINGNGINYINTNFIPSNSSLTNTSGSLGVYNRTNTFQVNILLGGNDATGNGFNLLLGWSDNLNYFDCYNPTSMAGRLVTGTVANCQGLNIGTRTSLTDSRFFQNGNQLAAITTGGGLLPTVPTYLFAFNNNGSALYASPKSLGLAFIGKGLAPTQVSTLTTIVNQLMTDLGRAV